MRALQSGEESGGRAVKRVRGQAMEKAGCKSIVFSSSGTTYGEAESPLVETMETGIGITNPYRLSFNPSQTGTKSIGSQ